MKQDGTSPGIPDLRQGIRCFDNAGTLGSGLFVPREVINRVENVDCRLLLEKRSLLFQTWMEICADLNMSLRWAQTRYKEAVGMVQEILDEIYPEY